MELRKESEKLALIIDFTQYMVECMVDELVMLIANKDHFHYQKPSYGASSHPNANFMIKGTF